MKRSAALFLALLLALSLTPALAEEIPEAPAPSPLGDWYGEYGGMPLQLTLREDGVYSLSYPGLPASAQEGKWTMDEGYVFLNGEEAAPLSFDGDRLSLSSLGLYFTREEIAPYVPGEINSQAALEAFAGAWRSAYILTKGAALPAKLLKDDTRIYVEDARAALMGKLFGQMIVDLAFENGALTCEDGGLSLRMEMQADFLLRMTVLKDGEETVMVLSPFRTEGLFPEEEAAGE